MKRIIHYIAFLAAMLAVASCVEPLDSPNPIQGQTFSLSFSCGVMTKADRLATGNEDLIKQIDYFFFPLNADDTVDDDAEYLFRGTYKPSEHNLGGLEGTYTETLDHSALEKIFPDGATKAMVFAVANFVDKYGAAVQSPNTTIPEDAKTWAALHGVEVGESFFKNGGSIGTNYFGLRWPRKMEPNDEALFFVMTGEEVIDLHAADNEIPLKRLASKVTVNFTYQNYEEVKESGNIMWVPQPSGEETRVYLSNAIEHTTLGGPLTRALVADSWSTCTKPEVHNGTPGDGSRDIFEYAYDFMNDITTTTSDNKKLAHYYTYPISMKEGDDNQPYIKLVLPWYGYKNYGTDQQILYKQKEVYYKIVIPRATVNEGNRIYEYNVTVNIIGSDKEVGLTGEYLVKNWLAPENPISSSVATGRYISLDIPKDEYDMYTDKIDIAFVSSGKVIAKVVEIYQENYSQPTMSKDYFMQNDAVTATTALKNAKRLSNEDIEGWVNIPDDASYVEINHTMDNNMLINNQKNSAFDMAPYVFKVTLHLEEAGDDTSFDRTITVTQYPSLFVTSRTSNGYAFVNEWSNTGATNDSRQCYDDRGSSSSNYRLGNFGSQAGTLSGSGTNDNPNIYIITTSILSDDSYVIGDPRSRTKDNLSNLSGLTNYRPTQTSGSDNIIAPKLIIASSYGAVNGGYYFDKATAEKRCAAYQEGGYPAGRWRVPTYAEIRFIATLSILQFIPSLFYFPNNDTVGYWSANGKVLGSSSGPVLNTSNTTNTAVRCVYDAWYWGEEPYQENATDWLGYHD